MPTSLTAAALDEEERKMVDEFVERVRAEVGDDLVAIWLYGSRARGERHEESDIDLLVLVKENVKEHDWEAISAAVDINLAHSRYPLTAFAKDLEWLKRRREIRAFFIQEVDRDKIVLYGGEP